MCRRAPDWPRSSDQAKAGYITADAHGTKVLAGPLAAEILDNRRFIRAPLSAQNERQFSADFRALCRGFAVSSAHRDRESEAAGLAASADINSPLGMPTIP